MAKRRGSVNAPVQTKKIAGRAGSGARKVSGGLPRNPANARGGPKSHTPGSARASLVPSKK